MANDLTNFGEALIGAHLFRTSVWSKPSSVYVALLTAVSQGETGAISEVASGGTGYARAAVACDNASWTPPTAGSKRFDSAVPITFPTPTAAWGTISHFALFDTATGGNAMVVAPLTTIRAVANGEAAPVFAPGALRVTFSGAWTDYLAQRIGDHLLRSTTFLKPSALAVALYVAGVELSGFGYTRVACIPNDDNWSPPVSGNGEYANAVALTWPAPVAPWGTLSDVVLFDAMTGGNEWCRVSGLSYPMDPVEPTTLPIGALVATLA